MGTEPWGVVGPFCESGDCLAQRPCPPLPWPSRIRGGRLAPCSAGALAGSWLNATRYAAEVFDVEMAALLLSTGRLRAKSLKIWSFSSAH